MPIPQRLIPSENFPKKVDVAIVGGGIIGVSTAYYLAKRNISVALFEKGEIACEQSSRNWGFCRSQGRNPAELPLMLESLEIWRCLSEAVGEDVSFRQTGILYTGNTEAKSKQFQKWADFASENNLSTRYLNSDEVVGKIPEAKTRWSAALFTPTDGIAEPTIAATVIARAAQKLGAGIFTNSAVRGFETKAGRVSKLFTEKGEVEIGALVVAGGAWSSLFLRRHGISFPQLKVRSSVMRTEPMEDIYSGGMWSEGFAIRRRADGGYTIAEGTATIADLTPDYFRHFFAFLPAYKFERDSIKLLFGRKFIEEWRMSKKWPLDGLSPFEECRILDPEPYEPLLADAMLKLREAIPAFREVKIKESWAGMIDVTPDAVPAISSIEQQPGLYLASGFSGHGFGIGPGAGHLMADLVSGTHPIVDPQPYRFGRFSDGSKLTPAHV